MTVGGRGWGVGYRTGGGGVHTDSVRRALSAMVSGCSTLCGGGYAGLYHSLRMPWCGVCIGQGCSGVWQGRRMGGTGCGMTGGGYTFTCLYEVNQLHVFTRREDGFCGGFCSEALWVVSNGVSNRGCLMGCLIGGV